MIPTFARTRRTVALALVHYPVMDRQGEIITTAITNLDVHDIARSARTYGVRDFFIVHPITAQRELVERVQTHWVSGAGAKRIPDRRAALELVRIVASLDEAIAMLAASTSSATVELWTTAASPYGEVTSFVEAGAQLATDGAPVLLLFGTGWGLSRTILEHAQVRLAPIEGVDSWNHLSVRAACAIALDRLLSPKRLALLRVLGWVVAARGFSSADQSTRWIRDKKHDSFISSQG